MEFDNAPVPASLAQWPEARSFSRMYVRDPERQSRFVMALFGFRQDLLEYARDEQAAEAVATVIRAFHKRYPEFMQDGYEVESEIGTGTYYMDDRLQTYMDRISEPGNTETEPK